MTESHGESVALREMWPNEAYDFTPWLAEHLDQLGEAVGLSLEPEGQEHQVGSFSLDILARETSTGKTVAIENQLEWSNHGHLGQLLTYAAGCNAGIAIWVASDFQYEHAKALHKLNQWAGSNITFYGVKVEVIRSTSDGLLKAVLRRVVFPGGWDKSLTLPTPPPENPEIRRYREFFDALAARLRQTHSGFETPRQAFNYRDRFFPSSFHKDMGCVVSFEGEYVWIYLYIRTWDDAGLSNRLFDRLAEDSQLIESSIDADADWAWEPHAGLSFATIGIRKSASIDNPPERQAGTSAWMLNFLPKFKEVLEPRLESLLAELRADSP
ncbi:MAG: hypothetical protein OXC99_11220 [Chloroflexi bacterium]|nr:hypothetical protein [Chloroflexota bacterium]